MVLARRFAVCVTFLVLVWSTQGTALGRGGGGGGFHGGSHESFHPEHSDYHPDDHRDYRPDEHRDYRPGERYYPHDDPGHYSHYDPHHDPHYGPHYPPYHPSHYDPHHDPHYGPHYPPYYPPHYGPHHNPDWYRYVSHHEWWHYRPVWHNRPWWAWWNHPAWIEVSTWFAPWGWTSPIYYNYAPTQVVDQDQTADSQEQPAATSQPDFQAATTLAAVSTDDTQDDQTKWFSLGMFALSKYDDNGPPTLTVQLAVNKDGVLSGVLYDLIRDTTTPIHGSVDKSTQRAAFTLNEKGDLVAETGISNLTEQETSLLVHQGPTQRALYRLTRLDSPPSAGREMFPNDQQ